MSKYLYREEKYVPSYAGVQRTVEPKLTKAQRYAKLKNDMEIIKAQNKSTSWYSVKNGYVVPKGSTTAAVDMGDSVVTTEPLVFQKTKTGISTKSVNIDGKPAKIKLVMATNPKTGKSRATRRSKTSKWNDFVKTWKGYDPSKATRNSAGKIIGNGFMAQAAKAWENSFSGITPELAQYYE